MNKYRIIEFKGEYGYPVYVAQKYHNTVVWVDISPAMINKDGAMERIRRDITNQVVWEGTEEDVLRPMQEWQKEFNDNDESI